MKKQCYPFRLFKLPYSFAALEPYIDAQTMKLHHTHHLKNYTAKLNDALKPYPELHNRSLEWLLTNINHIPVKIRSSIRDYGGGVYNHIYYFMSLVPPNPADEHLYESGISPNTPTGELAAKINKIFGSWDCFCAKFTERALDVFGSGYLWLVADRRGYLKIMQTADQDSPITRGFCPLMTIDLWEHAYYLKHRDDRAAYIEDWFSVLNAEFAEENFLVCVS